MTDFRLGWFIPITRSPDPQRSLKCDRLCIFAWGWFLPLRSWPSPLAGEKGPPVIPQDFKLKTSCLHSVSYAGVWRGQATLSVDDFLLKAKQLGYDGVELMAKRPHLSPVDYDDAARQKLRAKIGQLGLKLVALAAYTDFTAGMDKPRHSPSGNPGSLPGRSGAPGA